MFEEGVSGDEGGHTPEHDPDQYGEDEYGVCAWLLLAVTGRNINRCISFAAAAAAAAAVCLLCAIRVLDPGALLTTVPVPVARGGGWRCCLAGRGGEGDRHRAG